MRGGGGHGTGCVSHLPAGRGGTQTIPPASPTHEHAKLSPALPYSLLSAPSHALPCSLTLSIFLSPTQYLSLSHSPPVSVRPHFLCLPLPNTPPYFFPFHLFAVPSPCLLRCVFVPLIRFGPGAISFGPVCGSALPRLAEYPGRAPRLCRRSRNRVSRA